MEDLDQIAPVFVVFSRRLLRLFVEASGEHNSKYIFQTCRSIKGPFQIDLEMQCTMSIQVDYNI